MSNRNDGPKLVSIEPISGVGFGFEALEALKELKFCDKEEKDDEKEEEEEEEEIDVPNEPAANEHWLRKRRRARLKRKELGIVGKPRVTRWLHEERETVWQRDMAGPHICIDLRYESKMAAREARSLRGQFNQTYGFMRKQPLPPYLTLINVPHVWEAHLHKIGAYAWPIRYESNDLDALFSADELRKVVYLSPDADQVLRELDNDAIYVIGGIVDHNRLKGTTKYVAGERGMRCMRLPLAEHLTHKINNSLNVNHVFEILALQCRQNDWKKTFEQVLPKRVIINKPKISRKTRKKLREQAAAALEQSRK